MSTLSLIGVIISQMRSAMMIDEVRDDDVDPSTSSAAIASKVAGEREPRTTPRVMAPATQGE